MGLSYSAENGFGASVGVGYGPATVNLGISERGGTTVDLGLKSGAFNGGLSYNSKTRSVSGNAGLTTEGGTGFALSYNEGDGFGASISKSLDSGLNGGLSWSQKGGVGGSIGYEAPGDKNQPKNSLANQMKGAGGSLSFNQRDGVSASVSASGGVNAGNWSQSGGFQANTNFLADQWKADFVSKQDAIEQAKTDAESKAAQDKNNAEQGASNIAAAGISTQRREENILDHVLNKAGDALGDAWDGVKGAFGNNDASESLCFVSGTLVLTGTGLKAIDRVKIGDEVLAFNPETKDQSLKSVVRLFRNETQEVVKINFGDGEEVVTTPGHRFFTETRGFVLAGDLTKEDLFLDKAGEKISIHSIVKETHKEKIPVFNFEVEDYHTYYVGETCILVHNDSVKMLQEKIGAGEKPVGSQQNVENGNGSLKPVKSYENTGFFEGIGQRFSNLVSGNGFNTNAGLIHNAEAYGGKLAGLLKASELGYASSAKDVAEVVDYYQKNNRDNNLQMQTEAGKNIVSQAERLMKLNQISPFTYKLGNTGTGGLMDCTGFIYRSNKNAGFDHIPYIGGSSIEVSDHYKALNPSERQAGDIKIITIRDSNGKVVDGHGMIYNGGKTGKEFYEMSSKGMKTNGDYMEKHYTGIYGKKMEKEGYTMEGGYYRPLEKQ
ncbi:polymorphic toxin-type HINT domain-containing protein [Leptospira santarosai]|uniref:polymorphic toxin-type HINT domain-containing protein n=1 Tax=Leptospira santarosai TaxID=28183 RepID=UPI0024AF45D6|nr:polymorphic toxin-type HINT domain-containing protein [Leptospira santarosai]MDI7184518.1 polymorphic toxin-type HINT domain-containing protein [Leptospira santarosai]